MRSRAFVLVLLVLVVVVVGLGPPALAQELPQLSEDGRRIAVNHALSDAGGGVAEASICPVFDAGAKCETFIFGGQGGEGWDRGAIDRARSAFEARLAHGGFKPALQVPLQSILPEEMDFAPIRVKRRNVRARSGRWTIEVKGGRRFAIAVQSEADVTRGVASCGPGASVTGAVTSAVLVEAGPRRALWIKMVCQGPDGSSEGWERVTLDPGRTSVQRKHRGL